MTGLETFLLQRVGTAVAKKALADIAKPSFSRKLVRRIRRVPDMPRLSLGQRSQLRSLLQRADMWPLLFKTTAESTDLLAANIRTQVLAGSKADSDQAAVALALAAQAQTPGALELPDLAAQLTAEVRDVGDKVDVQSAKIDDVRRQLSGIDPSGSLHLADVAIRGPLLALGLGEKERAAKAARETDLPTAHRLLTEIIQALNDANLSALARPFQREQAEMLIEMQEVDQACAALLALVRADIDDGASMESRWAQEKYATLVDAGTAPAWLPARIQALAVIRTWFGDPGTDPDGLAAALVAVISAGDPEADWIAAAGVDCLLADRANDSIRAMTVHLDPLAASAEESTRVRLLAAMAEANDDESRWDQLLRDASLTTARLTTGAAALVYARRGRYLFWRGEEGAADAYANAIAMASYGRFWQDVAKWMYAQWRTKADQDVLDETTFSLPGRASSIRTMGTGSILGRRYDAEAAGLEYRMEGKLPSALTEFRRGLRDSVRLGHVEDELGLLGWLGELYRYSSEPEWSVTAFALAGDAKEAEATAKATSSSYLDIRDLAALPRRQTCAAALLAATAQSDLIPDNHVRDWITLALNAIHDSPRSVIGPQAWVEGFKVLAALAERTPADLVDAVIEVVKPVIPRPEGRYTFVDDQVPAILNGLAVAFPERKDDLVPLVREAIGASTEMARALIHGEAVARWFSDFAAELRERAAGGDTDSTVALCINLDDDAATLAAAEAAVDAALNAGPAYGVGMVAFRALVDLPAHAAAITDPKRRNALARKYAADAADGADVESNRAQAAQALAVMAEHLSEDVKQELLAIVLPIARGNFQRSDMDMDEPHPLSAFKFGGAQGALRRRSLVAAAALSSTEEDARDVSLAGLELARSGVSADVLAAAKAWYRLAQRGFVLPLSLPENALSPDVHRRQLAAAMVARSEHLGRDTALALARDVEMRVRREIALSLDQLAEGDPSLAEELRAELLGDVSYSVRRAARAQASAVATNDS